MKTNTLFAIAALLMIGLASCEQDNFDPISATITGRLTYQGQPIGVRTPVVTDMGDNTGGGIQLELWQPAYELNQRLPVFVAQDGSFSAVVSNGEYQLIPLRGNGPWVDVTDTIQVVLNGSAEVEIPVQPYFYINNTTFERSGNNIHANFNIEEVVGGRALESVTLFISTTNFVDSYNNVANAMMAGGDIADMSAAQRLSIELPANLVSRGYVFARVGVRTAGITEMLYSQVERVDL